MEDSQNQSQESWRQAVLDCCKKGQWTRGLSALYCVQGGDCHIDHSRKALAVWCELRIAR